LAPIIGHLDSLIFGVSNRVFQVSGCLVAPIWLPGGFPGREDFLMPIRISDGFVHLEIGGKVVVTATERPGAWREVTYWPQLDASLRCCSARRLERWRWGMQTPRGGRR